MYYSRKGRKAKRFLTGAPREVEGKGTVDTGVLKPLLTGATREDPGILISAPTVNK